MISVKTNLLSPGLGKGDATSKRDAKKSLKFWPRLFKILVDLGEPIIRILIVKVISPRDQTSQNSLSVVPRDKLYVIRKPLSQRFFWAKKTYLLSEGLERKWILEILGILESLYSAGTRYLHQVSGLPGHFDKNFHEYQMKIGSKLDDTPSLDHLAGQEVPHHLFKCSVTNFFIFWLTWDIFIVFVAHF